MVNWTLHGRKVLPFQVIKQGVLVLGGFCAIIWRADAFASPTVVGSPEQISIVTRTASTSVHEHLVRGEEALARYANTGGRTALTEALELLSGMSAYFSPKLLKARQAKAESLDAEDVIAFARFSNVMFRYTGQPPLFRQARDSLDFLKGQPKHLSGEARRSFRQAEEELRTSPLHITVVGAKSDVQAQLLWKEAVRVNDQYLRREWWDRREGALPNPDVRYPQLASAAAFVCVDTRCSVPLFTEQELRERLAQREMAK